jgi:hypothetical protein
MTYPAGEALILSELRTITGFDSSNTSRANWGILNSGAASYYAVVKPGPFTEDPGNNFHWIYTTVIQVWQFYKDDGTTATELEASVQKVKEHFTKARRLGGSVATITDSRVIGGGEMQEQWNKDGGLVWLSQDVVIEWKEQEIVTYNE